MNTFPWTLYLILVAAGLIGTLAVMPYAFAMNPDALRKLKEMREQPAKEGERKINALLRSLPLPAVLAVSGLQSTLLVAVTAFLGLLAARAVGLDLPVLRALLDGRPAGEMLRAMLPEAMLLGAFSGAAILLLEAFYFKPRIDRKLAAFDKQTAFWKRVLACFYGGVVEELLMRLFVMSGLAWLLGLVWQGPAGLPAAGAFWTANILAALLFGAGHLPATKAITKLTPTVVARGLLLNGIPGVVCGYLYMTYGLEAAMLCHFSLDILIHLIAPPLIHKVGSRMPVETGAQAA